MPFKHLILYIAVVLFCTCCQTEPAANDKDMSSENTTDTTLLHLLFLGNSITAGYGLEDPLQSFPSLLARRFEEEGHNFRVTNAGISGETTAGALQRLPLILEYPVDILVIELGINDYLQGMSRQDAYQNIEQIIRQARSAFPEILVFLTDIQLGALDPSSAAIDFQQLYPELARKTKVELLPSYLQKVWTETELVMADRLHPNAKGYELIAEEVYKTLINYL